MAEELKTLEVKGQSLDVAELNSINLKGLEISIPKGIEIIIPSVIFAYPNSIEFDYSKKLDKFCVIACATTTEKLYNIVLYSAELLRYSGNTPISIGYSYAYRVVTSLRVTETDNGYHYSMYGNSNASFARDDNIFYIVIPGYTLGDLKNVN